MMVEMYAATPPLEANKIKCSSITSQELQGKPLKLQSIDVSQVCFNAVATREL